ncbi:Gfo/Idh/MocA family oxidoreductase [Bacillaceae bacterium CLA-AA-H227]|uniref:Gfo/Idh/MocA family oxidoreductase n=1 Tax=Robertmurraya yapensis (ex Hitch et al 2024) TaxID=3133160 RepID=A0ACC6SHE5_9BACI
MKNVAIVGMGFMGMTHLQAYQKMKNVQVTAIESNEFDELLRKKVDVIDICLPTFLHEEYIIKAAHAGKHIICEKPLTLTSESAARIIDAVQQNNVRLFVGHVLRFWPEYKQIKLYSKKEKYDIVHAQRLGQLPKWSTWFQYPEKSGGALFDLHIHDIDFLSYVFGEVESVFAVGSKNQFGAWDHVMSTLSFKNGSKAFVEGSHRMTGEYPFTFSFRAQSRESTIELNVVAGENIESISSNQFFRYDTGKKSSIEIEKKEPFENELAYFIHCLESNEENDVIPLEDVLYTLRILEAIQQSLETGRVVRI